MNKIPDPNKPNKFLFNGWNVDLSESGFSELKLHSIRKLGMGDASKFQMQWKTRFWRNVLDGTNGETYCSTDRKKNITSLYQFIIRKKWTIIELSDSDILCC